MRFFGRGASAYPPSPETLSSGAMPPYPGPGLDLAPPRKSRWRWWKRGFYLFSALFALLIAWLAITAPLSKSLEPIAPPSITLMSADGKPIARRGAIIEAPVVLSELPDHVPAAFLAIEDRRFNSHFGIDPRGIARAMWNNIKAGGMREGGSTITQQLAKMSFLSNDRTFGRKAQEAAIALWLEAWLTKDEILTRYISNAYFGDNVYGLRAAAHHYFNRDPDELTVAQSAMLAGLMKAPSRLAPTKNLKGAQDRGKLVIGAMVETGALTPAEARRAKPARLNLGPVKDLPSGTYFADWVLPQARAAAGTGYGEQTIETTLDSRLQALANRVVRRSGAGANQLALVAMRPDGQVVAMVGGKSYKDSPFNRATQAKRQPGSTFKLFVYLAAIRDGMTPDSQIEDAPLTIGNWSPRNSDGRYRGTITLKQAFAASSNVAAVRLSERVGRPAVIEAARDFGITSPLADNPSIALGTSGVTLLEMTAAYAAVAASAYPVKAHGIPEASEQGWFDRFWGDQSRIGGCTSEMLHDLLFASANEGTGRAAALSEPTYGKTGTTQDGRDAIFIGFSKDLVVGVWVGRDDNKPVSGLAGGGLPARIWRDFMGEALGVDRKTLPEPAALEDEVNGNTSINAIFSGEEGIIDLEIESPIGTVNVPIPVNPEAPEKAPTIRIAPPPPAREDEPDAAPPQE
ncbi:transglycosylase domain-containing protein [Allosphingosinicella vermicomposti]|uniref:transglycosylase domain-containing protein n=1 Tax=Allosphingosinicella vermicomposti TaxID=614671 RepID=UPI000D108697|nr:PBP1A family penicillin-binding protein [Allosphingosinicella vermicomposti]